MTINISISNQTFELLPDRAMYWFDANTLLLSDLHLGKSGHFRKSGIAAPQQINQRNLHRLNRLVKRLNPGRVIILGDLFHSNVNREWFQLEEWRSKHTNLEILLIAGNHDMLHASFYESANINFCSRHSEAGFIFLHDSSDQKEKETKFLFSGHIHPGVRLKGKGRQSLRLPCFYQTKNQLILPAFGEFTGLHVLPESDAVNIYPIADQKIFQISTV